MVYLPPHFEETDPARLHAVIRDAPLGTLVTLGADGLRADHIPFVLDTRAGEHGRLLGHVARNNLLWHDHDPEHGALVVFQLTDAYVTPSWYATKGTTHEVVPTWNYAVVHASGPLVVHDDEKWLRGQAGMLTKQQEATQSTPWKMADAPRDYLATMLAQIVGIEIPIVRLIGKFKASQNRVDADFAGAVSGLRDAGQPAGALMADVMEAARRR